MGRPHIAATTIALVLSASTAGHIEAIQRPAANASRVQSTGIFSTLKYNVEGGDLLGVEVFIVYGGGSYMALVQVAEGEPAPPVLVPVTLEGDKVRFSLRLGNQPVQFNGVVTKAGLKGRFDTGAFSERSDGALTLPRKNSYWQ